MGIAKKVQKSGPSTIKKLFYRSVPFSYRYERTYRNTLRQLLANEERDTEVLLAEQNTAFLNLLGHAARNVPFYRNYLRENGLTIRDFESVADIVKLPVVNKEIINSDPRAFIDERLDHDKLLEFKTSGSTGAKFIFRGTDSMYKKEAAFVTRAYRSHGSNLYDDWSFWIRRYVPASDRDPLFKEDPELRRIYMSAYHLNNQSVHEYVELINRYRFETISTYPSSAYSLACLLEEEGLRIPYVKSIHLASEMLIDAWADKIRSVLPEVRLKAHYGQMEKTAFFHQTEESDNYVDDLEYGVTEFVDFNGVKKVIGTGFLNEAMPFIRYDTGDTVELLDNSARKGTGLPETVRRFIGRSDDIIITPEGNRLPGVNFYTMMYKIPWIKMFQIIQEETDKVRVKIVPYGAWTDEMADTTRAKLSERLGSMKIYIEECSEIPRSSSTGKIRCIHNAVV